jgi:hypothetical protein
MRCLVFDDLDVVSTMQLAGIKEHTDVTTLFNMSLVELTAWLNRTQSLKCWCSNEKAADLKSKLSDDNWASLCAERTSLVRAMQHEHIKLSQDSDDNSNSNTSEQLDDACHQQLVSVTSVL